MFFAKKLLTHVLGSADVLSGAVSSRNYNVTVVGGASEIGQTVCMLLKTQPSITKLAVYDRLPCTPCVALDLSHIPTETVTKCYTSGHLEDAVEDADLVIGIGELGSSVSSRTSLLAANAEYVTALCQSLLRANNSLPFVGILAEPINSIIPMAAEILRGQSTHDPRKLFGITGVDSLRAQSMYASEHGLRACECYVPVIGGHSEKTLIPLTSKSTPYCAMNVKRVDEYTTAVRQAAQLIIDAHHGYWPTLSPACSVLLFAHEVLLALAGEPARVQAFVENNDFGTGFFAGLVELDEQGIIEMIRYTNLSQYEFQLLEFAIIELRREINEGKRILEIS